MCLEIIWPIKLSWFLNISILYFFFVFDNPSVCLHAQSLVLFNVLKVWLVMFLLFFGHYLFIVSGDASIHHSEISNIDPCSSRKGEMMDISTSGDSKGSHSGVQVAYEHEKNSTRCFQTRFSNLQELHDKRLNSSTAMLEYPSYVLISSN